MYFNELIGWFFTVSGFYLMLSNINGFIFRFYPNGEMDTTRNHKQSQNIKKFNLGAHLSGAALIIQGFLIIIYIIEKLN
jgi:hypothetical protein